MRQAALFLGTIAISWSLFAQQGPYPAQQDFGGDQDQPGQAVARLSVINGEASVRRGDSGEWVAAALNAPLMTGDSIAVGPGGSAELQLDYANFVRIAGDSEIRISDLENGRNQIQVARGMVTYRALRDSSTQSEISTPAVAVHPLRFGAVRVEVSPDGSTRIIVRRGDVEAATPQGSERIHEGTMMLLRGGAGDPEYQLVSANPRDSWDNWNDQRDSYLERAQSNRYVSQDIYGAEDLDAYGSWGYDPAYGNVWSPNVPATWAPYRNGQWVWEDYYGWTWVDYSPWGWAPFHYGSWYLRAGYGWSWYPGPRYGHYWWHPALVSFFGFGGFGVGVGFGNVGWVPLAPFEVFHPWYGRGGWGDRRFGTFNNVNIVNNTNIVNIYRNARVGNGVTAVSGQDFQRGSFRNQFEVNRGQLQQASLVRGTVPIAPTASNLRFNERAPAAVGFRGDPGSQRFFSRMPAASTGAQRTPFVQQQAAVRSTFEGRTGQVAAAAQQPGGSGWRRFGEPAQANSFQGGSQTGRVQPQSSGQQSYGGAGWNRFGSPQAGAVPRSAAPERFAQPQQYAAPQQEQSQGRLQTPYSRRPAYDNYQGYGGYGAQPRSVQVAPPIVRQREAPQSYQYQGGGGAYRAAPAPSYQSAPAPASRYGGGGSYRAGPAPSFRSAPAPSYRGGNGGGSAGTRGRR